MGPILLSSPDFPRGFSGTPKVLLAGQAPVVVAHQLRWPFALIIQNEIVWFQNLGEFLTKSTRLIS